MCTKEDMWRGEENGSYSVSMKQGGREGEEDDSFLLLLGIVFVY